MYSVSTCLTRSILVGGSLCVGIGSMVWGSEEQAPIVNVTVSRAKPEVGPDGVSYVVVKPDTQGIDVVIPLGGTGVDCLRLDETAFLISRFDHEVHKSNVTLISQGCQPVFFEAQGKSYAKGGYVFKMAWPTIHEREIRRFLNIPDQARTLMERRISDKQTIVYQENRKGLCGGSAQGNVEIYKTAVNGSAIYRTCA